MHHKTTILTIAILSLLLPAAHSFYIHLGVGDSRCFYNNLFADEQLLVQIETPIISVAHRIVLKVTANGKNVLQKDIINQVKITVPKASLVISDNTSIEALEYETCLQIEPYKDTKDEAGQIVSSVPIPRAYMLSVRLMANFSHKLQGKVEEVGHENIDYKRIEKASERLLQLNQEQVNLHQISEAKEKLTQTYLQALKEKVILYSVIQIFMLLLFTIAQARLLRGYINDVSIV